MYESYSWPGAHSVKAEIKIVVNWIKELLGTRLKRLERPAVQN